MTERQKADLTKVISIDPGTMHGTACFAGTRVPVQTLLDYIEENDTLDSFLNDFPSVSRNQAVQFLEIGTRQIIECVSSQTSALILV